MSKHAQAAHPTRVSSARHQRALPAGRAVPARRSGQGWRAALFALIAVTVLGTAGVLLWPALARGGTGSVGAGVIAIQADMAGFSPSRIEAKVGQPLTIRLRSMDTSMHSDGGGRHQFAIDELGVNIVAPPEGVSEQTFTPTRAGVYTFYCDICCGGKANPTMHGELVVQA